MLAPESVRRHVRGHLATPLRDEILGSAGTSLEWGARLMDIADAARDVRIDADRSGDARTALAAGKAEAVVIGQIVDRLGIVRSDVAENVRDALDLLGAIRAVAPQHPETLRTLADGLDARGRSAWARAYREAADSFSETKEVSA